MGLKRDVLVDAYLAEYSVDGSLLVRNGELSKVLMIVEDRVWQHCRRTGRDYLITQTYEDRRHTTIAWRYQIPREDPLLERSDVMLETDVIYANYTGPGVVRVRRGKHEAKRFILDKVKDHAERNKIPGYTVNSTPRGDGVTEISWTYQTEDCPKHSYRLTAVKTYRSGHKVFEYHCGRCDKKYEDARLPKSKE